MAKNKTLDFDAFLLDKELQRKVLLFLLLNTNNDLLSRVVQADMRFADRKGSWTYQVPVQFFIEDKFTDKAILERLPPAFAQDLRARSRLLQMVKWHVVNHLDTPDPKFFEEKTIPEDFVLNGQIFVLSYYLIPPRRPAPVRAHNKVEKPDNLSANIAAQPFASGLTLANIIVLLLGFALSLLGFVCDLASCKTASTYGQLVTAFAALVTALLDLYLSFFSATYQ